MSIPKVAKFSKKLIKQRKQDFIESVEAEIMEIRAESKREKDIRKLNAIEKKIASRQDKIIRVSTNQPQTKAEKAIFEPINLGSQQQMSSLLYLSPFGFKFPIIKYTKDKYNKDTTNPSTAEETIIELIKYDKHGFIKQLLELRKLVTINSTFVLGIREKLGADGKIHPTFNIHGTVTGRMCIASNSLIHTSRGLLRIGDIIPKQPGIIELQEVYMALTHNKQYQKITHAINKGEEEMFKVTLDNGKSIQCTKSHMFLTDRGWMKLKDITNENIICWSDDNNKY
jgi:hypothetical protein